MGTRLSQLRVCGRLILSGRPAVKDDFKRWVAETVSAGAGAVGRGQADGGLTLAEISVDLVGENDVVLDVEVAEPVVFSSDGHALAADRLHVARLGGASANEGYDVLVKVRQVPFEP